MDRWQGKLAIVTGASAGIGAAISQSLVKAGMEVVGMARRPERVEALAKQLSDYPGTLHAYKGDITSEEDILATFQWATQNFGPVHVLINNAGIARPIGILDGTTEDFKSIIETNLLGLTIATREACRNMMANHVKGHIVNINSIMGHYVAVVPLSNVYPATKHGVTALTETLRQELFRAGQDIKVTSVSPGHVRTDIFAANGFLDIDAIRAMENAAPSLQSGDVADAVLYVLGTPPNVQSVVNDFLLQGYGINDPSTWGGCLTPCSSTLLVINGVIDFLINGSV